MANRHDQQRIARPWMGVRLLIRNRFGSTPGRLRASLGASRVELWRDRRALGDADLPFEEHVSGGEEMIFPLTAGPLR